jgi:hypothetical protein
VINTANFLHVLSFQVEFPSVGSDGEQDFLLSQPLDDVNQQLPTIHPEWEDESERSYSFSNVRSTSSTFSVTSNTPNMSPNFTSSSNQRKSISSPMPHGNSSSNQESEYDFMEDTSELPRETISAFRKRRLADKKYEFTDENTENIPLKVMRKRRDLEHQLQQQQQQPFVVVSGSKDVNEDWEWNFSCTVGTNDVLRPFNSNIPTPIRSPDWDRLGELVEDIRPPIEPQREPSKLAEPPTCVAQFQRRYFEVDDELVSVITDIEGRFGAIT